MEKKRGQLIKKKRGRPLKIKKVEEDDDDEHEELKSNSSDGDVEITARPHASSTAPASASLATRAVSRCQTRYAEALADKKAALSTPSRVPLLNNDGNPSEASTLLLVKQTLFGANRSDTASNVLLEAFPAESLVQAQDFHSQPEIICPDKTTGAQDGTTVASETENQPGPWKDVLDLKKFTSDLLAQTQQPELSFQTASSCSEEIMVKNNLPEREATVVSNIFTDRLEDTANDQTCERPTGSSIHSTPMVAALVDNNSSENNEVISALGNPFVDVDGYKVKKEVVPLLKAIFQKYGDIAKESTFSMESRSCLLELVCSIYKRLEASKIFHLTPLELQSMLGQIGDLELVNVEVGWLRKRLDQISKARQMYDGVSALKEAKARTLLVIDEKQKAVRNYEKELEATMAAVKKLQERLQQEKDELAAAMTMVDEINNFYDGSLVHGLI